MNPSVSHKSAEWVFGIHSVEMLLKTSHDRIERLIIARQKNPRLQKLVDLAVSRGVAVERAEMGALSDYVSGNHQGVCALCGAGEARDEKWLGRLVESLMQPGSDHKPLLLILDGITDPHNLGACLRTADATGVDAVIVPKDNSATLTPVVRKVASGAAETVPLVVVTNLARCMAGLQELGVWITGLSDQAEQTLFDVELDGPVALALGAEGSGLRRLTKEHCDRLASIPMQGSVSSLNVSVAAGVCLYEVLKQRKA